MKPAAALPGFKIDDGPSISPVPPIGLLPERILVPGGAFPATPTRARPSGQVQTSSVGCLFLRARLVAVGGMGRSGASLLRDVGRRVAELRAARGWTQEVFAERAEVSVGYVRQVETGRENLTLTSLAKISALLDVDAAELFSAPASRERRRGRPPKRVAAAAPAPSDVAAHPRKPRKRA